MTYNFATDIEKRNPWTGNVYYISRMTSDWAERNPLNVDQLIEDVYLEFEGTEFEESREALRRVWTATLSMPIQGDKTVYPNRNGAHRPAAMKVWHTAGDYWRRGFRTGDTLPAMVPGHTITRLPEGGWICLFPREMHLLDEVAPAVEPEPVAVVEEPAEVEEEPAEVEEEPESVPVIDGIGNQSIDVVVVTPRPTERERNAAARQRRREQREAQRHSYEARLAQEAAEAEAYARQQERRKIFAAIGAAAVTLTLIYFFGLLGPAVFGLLAGGLLKG